MTQEEWFYLYDREVSEDSVYGRLFMEPVQPECIRSSYS